jgi:hypothetical protein
MPIQENNCANKKPAANFYTFAYYDYDNHHPVVKKKHFTEILSRLLESKAFVKDEHGHKLKLDHVKFKEFMNGELGNPGEKVFAEIDEQISAEHLERDLEKVSTLVADTVIDQAAKDLAENLRNTEAYAAKPMTPYGGGYADSYTGMPSDINAPPNMSLLRSYDKVDLLHDKPGHYQLFEKPCKNIRLSYVNLGNSNYSYDEVKNWLSIINRDGWNMIQFNLAFNGIYTRESAFK